jgi:hypothetical protein
MKRNELEVMADVLLGGLSTGDAIMAQEKRGQGDFVNSELLPRELRKCTPQDLEAAGIRLGETVDELFQRAMLPNGWKKVATDHSMWSKLVDDKGRERAAIFYKAAFYDRKAHLTLDRRFNYHFDYNAPENEASAIVTDCGNVIYRTATVDLTSLVYPERGKKHDALEADAKAWVTEHYPQWENRLAYWD